MNFCSRQQNNHCRRKREYDYQVVDIFQSNVNENVQEDGLHPDQSGQQIIEGKKLLLY